MPRLVSYTREKQLVPDIVALNTDAETLKYLRGFLEQHPEIPIYIEKKYGRVRRKNEYFVIILDLLVNLEKIPQEYLREALDRLDTLTHRSKYAGYLDKLVAKTQIEALQKASAQEVWQAFKTEVIDTKGASNGN